MESELSQSRRCLYWTGTLPGPVTGMTLSTEATIALLSTRFDLTGFDPGKRYVSVKRWWSLYRLLYGFWTFLRILVSPRRHRGGVYVCASSTSGLIVDLLVVCAAAARRIPVTYHHHVYTYIHVKDRRMNWIVRVIGLSGTHVFACERMRDSFFSVYAVRSRSVVVPPMKVDVAGTGAANAEPRPNLTIGFLSNITVEKGLATVLSVFAAIRQSCSAVELVVAGPMREELASDMMDDAVRRWPEQVGYRGPVYGDSKDAFFRSIDIFLFPSTTANESWGIVINEALSYGVPVLCTDRACMPDLVCGGGGFSYAPDVFIQKAIQQVREWYQQPDALNAAKVSAKRRAVDIAASVDTGADRLLAAVDAQFSV